jgi:hypothetical protein
MGYLDGAFVAPKGGGFEVVGDGVGPLVGREVGLLVEGRDDG